MVQGKGRGLLIFQTPSSPIGPKTQVYNFLKAPRKLPIFSSKKKNEHHNMSFYAWIELGPNILSLNLTNQCWYLPHHSKT